MRRVRPLTPSCRLEATLSTPHAATDPTRPVHYLCSACASHTCSALVQEEVGGGGRQGGAPGTEERVCVKPGRERPSAWQGRACTLPWEGQKAPIGTNASDVGGPTVMSKARSDMPAAARAVVASQPASRSAGVQCSQPAAKITRTRAALKTALPPAQHARPPQKRAATCAPATQLMPGARRPKNNAPGARTQKHNAPPASHLHAQKSTQP